MNFPEQYTQPANYPQAETSPNAKRAHAIGSLLTLYKDDPYVQGRVEERRNRNTGTSAGQPVYKLANEFPLLNLAEEAALFEQIEQGLETFTRATAAPQNTSPQEQQNYLQLTAAHQILLFSNVRLVLKIAQKRAGIVSKEDLTQQGMIGLHDAITHFDSAKGYRLSTFAVPTITHAMFKLEADMKPTLRLPGGAYNDWIKVHNVAEILTHRLQRAPLDQEIAQELDTTVNKVETLRRATAKAVSLNKKPGIWRDTLADDRPKIDDEVTDAHQRRHATAKLITTSNLMTPKQKAILALRFGIPELLPQETEESLPHTDLQAHMDKAKQGTPSHRAIGELLGVSSDAVRQVEKQALQAARNLLGSTNYLFD